MTARVWLVAVARTIVQLSPIWGAMLLDRLGYHTVALVLLLGAAVVVAVVIGRDFLRFRRAYLRHRRRGGS